MIYIDRDHIDSGHAGATVYERPLYGMERIMGETGEVPDEGKLIRFRLYDDDGELYYEGRLTDDDEAENQFAAVRWGETMAGTTTIKVRRGNGPWVQEIG